MAGDRSVVEWTGDIRDLPTVDTTQQALDRLATAIEGLGVLCSVLNKRLAVIERRLDKERE